MAKMLLRAVVPMKLCASLLCGLAAALSASAPAPGWKKPAPVTGKQVQLHWKDARSRPEYAVWLQDSPLIELQIVGKKRDSAVIARKGLGSLPTKLLVIPRDRSMSPKILDVAEDARRADFQASPIAGDEIWLWGTPPKDPCATEGITSSIGLVARMLDDVGRYHSINGPFLWRVKAAKPGAAVTGFYFSTVSEALESLGIPGINKAGEAWQSRCATHHGGACDHAFETGAGDWGKSYRVLFKNSPFDIARCPP